MLYASMEVAVWVFPPCRIIAVQYACRRVVSRIYDFGIPVPDVPMQMLQQSMLKSKMLKNEQHRQPGRQPIKLKTPCLNPIIY